MGEARTGVIVISRQRGKMWDVCLLCRAEHRVSAEGSGGDKRGSLGSTEPKQQWREHSLQGPAHTTVTSYQDLMTWPWRRGKSRQNRVGCVLSEGLPMSCRLGEEAVSSEGARTGGQVRA